MSTFALTSSSGQAACLPAGALAWVEVVWLLFLKSTLVFVSSLQFTYSTGLVVSRSSEWATLFLHGPQSRS